MAIATRQSGMVIILSVIIISAVLTTATVFGNSIIKEVLQSRLINQSIQAYYLAESGAERALHQVRVREAVPDCSQLDPPQGVCQEDTGRCSLDLTIPCVTASKAGGLGSLRGDWQVAVSNEPETYFNFSEGSSFQLDLFSPQQVKDAQINEVEVDSSVEDLTLVGELINLTNILQVSGATDCLNQSAVFKDEIEAPKRFAGLDGKSILTECSYTFRLTFPLNSIADQSLITVRVYDDSGSQIDIPSRLIIDSAATYGKSLQTITVRTPIRPPLSGLYDFVLFSEQEIIK